MSRSRKLVLLLVVFAVLVGAYFVVTNVNKAKEEKNQEEVPEKIIVSEVDKENIVKMTIKNSNGELTFNKKDEKWSVENGKEFNIDEEKIKDIERSFSYMDAERIVEENYDENTDLSKYGLDNPSTVATATLKDGKEIVMLLGNKTPDNNNYYLIKKDTPNVYTVWMNHGKYFNYQMSDLRITKIDNIDMQKFYYLYMKFKDKSPIEIITNDDQDDSLKSYGLGIWSLKQPYDIGRNVDSEEANKLFESIPQFQIEKFIEDNPKDLAKYGLEEPELDLILKERDPESQEIKEVHYLFGKTFDEQYVYFKPSDVNSVYAMSNSFISKLKDTEAFNLAEKLIFIVNIDLVDKIQVQGNNKDYELTIDREIVEKEKKETEDGEEIEDEVKETFKINGKLAEDGPFRDVYQNVIGIAADFEVNKEVSVNESKKVLIKYTFKDGDSKVIEYYPYDENFYVTKIQDKLYFACSNKQVEDMFTMLDKLEKGELKED